MHFIRAFPIVLVIVLLFGLCFAFADSEWYSGSSPYLLTEQPYYYKKSTTEYYYTSSDPVFLYYTCTDIESTGSRVFYSTIPATFTDVTPNGTYVRSLSDQIYIDGIKYYFTASGLGTSVNNSNIPILLSDSVAESLRYIATNPVVVSNNILYNITLFIRASNTWLSSIIGTVMANPLLIFILLFYFVGTAIGLLFRFRRN